MLSALLNKTFPSFLVDPGAVSPELPLGGAVPGRGLPAAVGGGERAEVPRGDQSTHRQSQHLPQGDILRSPARAIEDGQRDDSDVTQTEWNVDIPFRRLQVFLTFLYLC